jgi:hypothetical protein
LWSNGESMSDSKSKEEKSVDSRHWASSQADRV